VNLSYREALDPPVEVTVTSITKKAGIAAQKAFKKNGKAVKEWLESLDADTLTSLASEVKASGKAKRTVDVADGPTEFEFTPEMVENVTKVEKQTTTVFMPGVVEPSFGIDRILFSVLEHSWYARPATEGDKGLRGVLAFPASIAPYKLTLLPLDKRISGDAANVDTYTQLTGTIKKKMSAFGHSFSSDDSGATIGKRYARNDELGIPFAVTIDFDSLTDKCVTLRDRDSMEQVRMKAADVAEAVHDVILGRMTFADVKKTLAV